MPNQGRSLYVNDFISPVPNLLSCCHLARQALDAFFGFGDSRLKSQTKNELNWGADKAQWIRLRLPSCPQGLNPKHTIYAFINLNLNCEMLKRRK